MSEWMSLAACRENPDLMFPHSRDRKAIRKAQAVCARCPVFAACKAHVAKVKPTDGVWAGKLRLGRPSRESWHLAPCGTEAAARRHSRRGETCRVCLRAAAVAKAGRS